VTNENKTMKNKFINKKATDFNAKEEVYDSLDIYNGNYNEKKMFESVRPKIVKSGKNKIEINHNGLSSDDEEEEDMEVY
jgi:preprotein translocase subunit SecD